MTRVGFVHTAGVHVETFTRLLAETDPDASAEHVVDESLLADARLGGGVDDALRERLVARLRRAAAGGATAVLCTCSTIGGAAETLAATAGVPVVRIDRPMASLAVRTGRRIGIVAAVESTIEPTRSLLSDEAAAHGREVELVDLPCLDAWAHLEAGDLERYAATLVAHVDAVAGGVDVVVLAQASMVAAAARCRTTTPVLTSPSLAVTALLAAAHEVA